MKIRKYLKRILEKIKNSDELPIAIFKQNQATLIAEEKDWLLNQKILRKDARVNKKYKNSIKKVLRRFRKKFNKDLDESTIYWYWNNYAR